jgi:hypothetical protein
MPAVSFAGPLDSGHRTAQEPPRRPMQFVLQTALDRQDDKTVSRYESELRLTAASAISFFGTLRLFCRTLRQFFGKDARWFVRA